MAKLVISSTVFIYMIFALISQIQAAHEEYRFVQSADQKPSEKMMRREKMSHFKFYWHDIVGGKAPTAITVVPPAKTAAQTGFGMVRMIDNPLTLGPALNSTIVGRCQGFYASASLENMGLLMTMNFVFIEGKYNGSTIAILGRNSVFDTVREMPVVGGSKLFRFARGYAEARTHTFDLKTGDATVEYNLHVMHY